MSISGFSFIFWRIAQIITLIPTLGMLAWFVDWFNTRQYLTPREYLVLFIVSVLAAAWAMATLFLYSRARHSAGFVAFVDFLFVGAFIGAVWCLRFVTELDCVNWGGSHSGTVNLGIVTFGGTVSGVDVNKRCAMLKAAFAFGIMNCIFFFLTAIFALLVHHNHRSDRVVVKRETHYSRHGHRSRSPRHSHHSHRSRSYV